MLFKFIILFVTVNLLVELGNARGIFQHTTGGKPTKKNKAVDFGESEIRRPIDCAAIYRKQEREDLDITSGVYKIYPEDSVAFKVFCDMETDGGGWTVIQRRGEFPRQEDFYRDWKDYKNGFGNGTREFWLGNDKIYTLTNQDKYDLRFDLEDYDGIKRFALYSGFRIGDESTNYRMTYDAFLKGDAGDSLAGQSGMQFTTKDRDNDLSTRYGNCAQTFKGAWWHKDCHFTNPNGERKNNNYGEGLNWYTWHGYYYSLKKIEMKIRPSNYKL
ncbi:unnamed protein product [Adineta steineri]|uniref:Fibrinogen C-terminal domain-containing protein n=1 Tax=Adineta steineri TaxID=433720 RepID=A0A820AAK3_9BILA|nr:unnamed protein product [Adineta steineri]CAF1240875.1 unnamed protein product [Adineta steineri]CAF1285354.1 unnamed protein product [Adineta steineri]CAF3683125.1 unnamed protein product [Adineta steineri]CAF4031244.1 unnamed protein product [Adineta steineri]